MMEMNPIKMLTDALADMTARLMEVEQELEKAQKRGDEYFKCFMEARNRSTDLEAKLTAATELREQARQSLKEEKDLHMETWGKCKELMEIAVKAGVHKESLERMIYGPDALEEIREGGAGDAE